tara:strand:+ start:11758 stop:12165 length:408 start_codon:yes stop_codon:yes gene_type:complete
MPLVKSILEQKLSLRIKALEPKLYQKLNSKTSGLYKAQAMIDAKLSDEAPASGFGLYSYKNKVWTKTSDEWSKVIAKEVISILSDDLADIIAEEVTSYIKQATVIIPPGQAVTTAGSAVAQTGATTAPSPPAKIV